MEWTPKTKIGKMVKTQEITDIDEILKSGQPIIESEIVDALIPDIKSETLSVGSTQRVTDSGRKMKFRVVVVVGDQKGHVGIGSGKSEEIKPAIEYATKEAKKRIIRIPSGCGSWECRCAGKHSIPQRLNGKEGSTKVTLYPAPKGVGLAANDVIKKVLSIAGIRDVWSKTTGNTANMFNMASATIDALNSFNKRKPGKEESE